MELLSSEEDDDDDGDDNDVMDVHEDSGRIDETEITSADNDVTMCAHDVDCCIIPIRVSELLKHFPSIQMVSLLNYPVYVKNLENQTCVGEFGWRLFANVSYTQMICERLYSLGVTAVAHQSRGVFTKGRLTVRLHVLARGLMGGGVKYVNLSVYGMKISKDELRRLYSMQPPKNPPPSQFDIVKQITFHYLTSKKGMEDRCCCLNGVQFVCHLKWMTNAK